jgi:hypothetical protein
MPMSINEFDEMRPGSCNSRTDISTLTMLHFRFTRNKHDVRRSQWPRSLRRRFAATCLLRRLWVRIPPRTGTQNMHGNTEEQCHVPLSLATEVPACHSMQMWLQSIHIVILIISCTDDTQENHKQLVRHRYDTKLNISLFQHTC